MHFIFYWTIVNRSLTDVNKFATPEKILQVIIESIDRSNYCHWLNFFSYLSIDSSIIYYFPSVFHIFVTMSKRTWSTENEIYKKFKWIPFKIDSIPWNGLLKRHLWRRMIDTWVSLEIKYFIVIHCFLKFRNIRENRPVDSELIKTLHWITNVWQRYNECLQKLSFQDALLGPGLFFDCPMECAVIYE